jgi:hypothetical protein
MQQFLIHPTTHDRVRASEANAKILRRQGWVNARPARDNTPTDPGRTGIIVQGLRATDYDAAPTERIAAFLQSGNLEYAEGVLDYETDHRNRPHVLRLINARIDQLVDRLVDELDQDELERPAPTASRGDWNAYATTLGLDAESYNSKDDLIKAVADKEAETHG